jgi:Skp family chaperone for outer membrane proteins
MNKYFTFIACLITMLSFSQNFAYIKQADVLKALPNYENNIKKADSLKKNFEAEFKISNDAFGTKLNEILKKYNVKENETIETIEARMSELDKAKLDVLKKEEELLRKTEENYNLQLNEFYKNNIQNLLDKLNVEIEKYAKTNKIDAVYIYENLRTALAYIEAKKDITAEIIKRIK